MKNNTLIIIALAIAAVVMSTLFIVRPRVKTIFIEPTVLNISPPDTTYKVKYSDLLKVNKKLKAVINEMQGQIPDVIIANEGNDPDSLTVSRLEFNENLKYAELKSNIEIYSLGAVIAASDSHTINYNFELIKNEIKQENKPKFWKGFALGAGSMTGLILGVLLIAN